MQVKTKKTFWQPCTLRNTYLRSGGGCCVEKENRQKSSISAKNSYLCRYIGLDLQAKIAYATPISFAIHRYTAFHFSGRVHAGPQNFLAGRCLVLYVGIDTRQVPMPPGTQITFQRSMSRLRKTPLPIGRLYSGKSPAYFPILRWQLHDERDRIIIFLLE